MAVAGRNCGATGPCTKKAAQRPEREWGVPKACYRRLFGIAGSIGWGKGAAATLTVGAEEEIGRCGGGSVPGRGEAGRAALGR
jgi:hypothetical protein